MEIQILNKLTKKLLARFVYVPSRFVASARVWLSKTYGAQAAKRLIHRNIRDETKIFRSAKSNKFSNFKVQIKLGIESAS